LTANFFTLPLSFNCSLFFVLPILNIFQYSFSLEGATVAVDKSQSATEAGVSLDVTGRIQVQQFHHTALSDSHIAF
jgi:hypothetical protein